MLKTLNKIAQFLKPVRIRILLSPWRCHVYYFEECGALEENDFFSVGRGAQFAEVGFHEVEIGRETLYYVTPRSVQGLVPDTGAVGADVVFEAAGEVFDEGGFGVEEGVAPVGGHEIHFVDEAEDVRGGGVLV